MRCRMETVTVGLGPVFTVLVSAFFLFASAPCGAESAEGALEVIGSARVEANDVSAARTRAISDALAAAVLQAAVEKLPAEGVVANFRTLNEILFARAEEFVQSYEVLAGLQHGETFRVLVRASVDRNRIARQLESVGAGAHQRILPRLLFLVIEKNPESGWPQFWWAEDAQFLVTVGEQTLTETARSQGFEVVAHDQPVPDAGLQAFYYKPNLSNDEASSIAAAYQAGVVVVGEAVAGPALNTIGETIRSFKGTVSLRAIRTDGGKEIGAVEKTAIATGTDEMAGGRDAIAAAAREAGQTLGDQIAAAWRAVRGPDLVEIQVKGTGNLKAFVKLREVIAATHGVNGLEIRELQTDEALIVVDFQSNAGELAAALMVNDFGGFGVRIAEMEANRMTIELVGPASAGIPGPSAEPAQ